MKRISQSVWAATASAVVLFALFEVVKTILFPGISLTASHVMTVIVVGILSFYVSRYALKKHAATLTEIDRQSMLTDETNRLLWGVLATMREGVLIVDNSMRVVLYNQAATRVVKLPEASETRPENMSAVGSSHLVTPGEPVVPTQPLRLIDTTRDPLINDAFVEALKHRRSAEVRVELASANPKVFQLNVAPLSNDLAVGVFFDITQLEKLERVRREFFANLSHELRTPLTAILAHAETLLSGALDDSENRLRFVEKLHKQAARMSELLADISDLAAIESEQFILEISPVRLKPVAAEVAGLLDGRARDHQISILHNIPDELLVMADRSRLEQILFNLIDNGIKFNKPGGNVTISARQENDSVTVTVADEGIGISSLDLPRIFERLYRADKSRSRKTEGTGLGLAIVKHLVQAHQGEISANSDLGRGSSFSFSLRAPSPGIQESENHLLQQESGLQDANLTSH